MLCLTILGQITFTKFKIVYLLLQLSHWVFKINRLLIYRTKHPFCMQTGLYSTKKRYINLGFLFCCFWAFNSTVCTCYNFTYFSSAILSSGFAKISESEALVFPLDWHSAEAHITRSKPLRNFMFRRDCHTINFIAFVLLGIKLLSYPLHISTKSRPIPPGP